LDIADSSQITEEHNRLDAINKVVVSDKRELQQEGYCLNCYDELLGDKLFCNGDCATEYTRKKNSRYRH